MLQTLTNALIVQRASRTHGGVHRRCCPARREKEALEITNLEEKRTSLKPPRATPTACCLLLARTIPTMITTRTANSNPPLSHAHQPLSPSAFECEINGINTAIRASTSAAVHPMPISEDVSVDVETCSSSSDSDAEPPTRRRRIQQSSSRVRGGGEDGGGGSS